MVPLSNLELENHCMAVLDHIEISDSYLYPYFHYLYMTGSRPVEVLRNDYFVSLDGSLITVQPDKKNNQRIIQDVDVNNIMYAFLTTDYLYLKVRDYKRLNQTFHIASAPNNYIVEDKEMVLYLFRFNKVKKLVDSGLTDEQVRVKMGWNNILMVQKYYNTIVYVK